MKPQEFRPTAAMKLYAFQRAKMGENCTEKAVSKKIGISPETISRWKQINGFQEWLEQKLAAYRAPIHEQLEQVALEKLDDFRYWQALALKHGYIEKVPLRDQDQEYEFEYIE